MTVELARGEPLTLRSAAMEALSRVVDRVAATDLTVLITGETGAGKEIVAASMHRRSRRRDRPFHAINCGAVPDPLVCSTLFGHEHGSFTGALQTTKGVFELAEGGTVLLDEIAELSAPAQSALLRVLETRRFFRVGSNCERVADVRVLAATHRDLASLVDSGSFRRDLWFRLSGFVVDVPALRARREDIVPLARHFLREACSRLAVPEPLLSGDVVHALESYGWPGNARELRNAIERAVVMADSGAITVETLPKRMRKGLDSRDDDLAVDPRAGREAAAAQQAISGANASGAAYHDRVRAYEIQLILDGLRRCRGNQTKTASLLGIPLRTLVHKMRMFGLRETNLSVSPCLRRT